MKPGKRSTPPVDIYENRDEIMLVADMPGTRREELDVRFANDTLTVSATRLISPQGTPLVQEMAATELLRSFLVPKGIDTANINAELKNGVMRVHLPKSEALKPRQITVNAG
jgi:HSP20 family molecular chaperone IbpA